MSWRRYCQSLLTSPQSPPPRCLLHCAAGLNRSPLTAIYWLVCHHHIQPSVAWQYVAAARSRVNAATSKPLSSSKSPAKKEWSDALLAKASKKIAPQLQLWSIGVIQDALANVRALQAAHAWQSVSSLPVAAAADKSRASSASEMVFTFAHSLILGQEPKLPPSTPCLAESEKGGLLQSSAHSSLFLPGDSVVINGLVAAKHFNGFTGIVQAKSDQDPPERVKVLLPDNKSHFIKESNLAHATTRREGTHSYEPLSRQATPSVPTPVVASSGSSISSGSSRADFQNQLAQITHNYLVSQCHTSPSAAIRSDLLGNAIRCDRPAGFESIKLSDVLIANSHLFVSTRGEHGQFIVYAITKTAKFTAKSPRSDVQASSPRSDLQASSAEASSTPTLAAATASKDTKTSSYSPRVLGEEAAFLTAAHNYLTLHGHTSKSSSIDLSQLCAADSVRKHKSSSNSFKPSEALKAHVHMFRVVFRPSGASVYAVVPCDTSTIGQAEQRHPVSSTVRRDGVLEADTLRQARSVFVSHVSRQVSSQDLRQFFTQAGQVTDVQLKEHANPNPNASGCYAIVLMDSSESARKAVALSGQLVLGSPCIVKKYQAHLNFSQRSGEVGDREGSRKRIRDD